MHIVVVGLNYRTSPVEVREKFAISLEQLPQALKMLKQTKSILEGVIVGTCNRTEIYAVVDRLRVSVHFIQGFMEQWFQTPKEQFSNHLYVYQEEEAVRHLFRVTCGLDSMILGETQILGQVKEAFFTAQKAKTTGTIFNMLFKQAVTLAKRAHAETGINDNPVSVSYAAIELGKQIFGSFRDKTVMIIGAGKMGELTVKHLTANGANRILVVNRTLEKAQELARKFNGLAVSFDGMLEELRQTDIVISSTGASEWILKAVQVEKIMQKRRHRPLFMIDIAVPRDLDPAIGEVSNVFLYDIDDLQSIVDANLEERRREAAKIEGMIQEEMGRFQQWMKTLGLGPVIQALQQKANQIYEDTMDSLLKKLPHLSERELKVIRKLARSISNQILRDPILQIKDMAAERDGEQALKMFARIFALEEIMAQQNQEQKAVQTGETTEETADAGYLAAQNFQSNRLIARS